MNTGTIKQLGAVVIAIAIVLAAGTVVGQAPELFGADVADEPTASIEFHDQTGDGTNVTVDNVSLSEGGFVVVTDGSGEILGVSGFLESGSHENVTVERDGDGAELLGQLTATAYRDRTDDGTFVPDAPEDEPEDRPYVDDGYPVSDTATVTMDERDRGNATASFRVESVDAPSSATVNETVRLGAEIANPNDFETRQHVEVRLDGAVVERQVLSLEAEETRDLELEVDLSGVDPGTYVYGVYTSDHGTVGEIDVEDDAPANVSVVEAGPTGVIVDATLPSGGVVVAENETGSILGTSTDRAPGSHGNVTVPFEGNVEAGDEVTVVAYRERPDDASLSFGEDSDALDDVHYLRDGDRVAATATVEPSDSADDADGE